MKERLVLNFGQGNKASVLIYQEGNSLYLDKITNDIKMNCKDTSDVKTENCIQLNFYEPESVDAFIEGLERVKNDLTMLRAV